MYFSHSLLLGSNLKKGIPVIILEHIDHVTCIINALCLGSMKGWIGTLCMKSYYGRKGKQSMTSLVNILEKWPDQEQLLPDGSINEDDSTTVRQYWATDSSWEVTPLISSGHINGCLIMCKVWLQLRQPVGWIKWVRAFTSCAFELTPVCSEPNTFFLINVYFEKETCSASTSLSNHSGTALKWPRG